MLERTQVLVIGSGAGGSVTALELATRGRDVIMLEEGRRFSLEEYGASSRVAMEQLYRRRGMTPILGSTPIGYVEGRCVGGSTELNSGFWHRTPPEILLRWKARYDLADSSPEELDPHFEWAEHAVHVGLTGSEWPPSTKIFARGVEAMGWSAQEVPRAADGCVNTNTCAMGCPKGAKQGMSRSLVPRAEKAGVRMLTGCRAKRLIFDGDRVTGVVVQRELENGRSENLRIEAETVFVCAGPTETPLLLRRSGLRHNIGDTLCIHPMLKIAARFREEINAQSSVLPLLQVKEFWPEISLGGAFFTPGHLAMALSENWPQTRDHMKDYRRMAIYYVAVRGTARGTIRPSLLDEDNSVIRYNLSHEDRLNLSKGVARLATLLLAAGAEEVYPGVYGLASIRNEVEAVRWLDEELPASRVALTTVHAFSTCPIGENPKRCGANSFGKVHGYRNLYVNDASMLPDSPGVNPQGSVMGFARRNAIHFAQSSE